MKMDPNTLYFNPLRELAVKDAFEHIANLELIASWYMRESDVYYINSDGALFRYSISEEGDLISETAPN